MINERKSGKRTDFQRLSALIELDRVWSEYEENGSDWDRVKSGQPIYLDASCNGYQHVSALLRDEELAHLTNLLESKVGPQDLYAAVAESARKGGESKIRKFLKKLGLSKELIQLFIESVFSRSVAKQPTIVRVYGSTDILKCLEGRKGKGRADRSHPVPKILSAEEEKEKEKITTEFQDAYHEWELAKKLGEKISRSHYQKHAKAVRGGGFSKTRAEKWRKLLQKESGLNLWATGSGLHDAIISPGGELADLFSYPDGRHWMKQHELAKLMAEILKKGISDATGKAYDKLQTALKDVSMKCDGLWPGIVWEIMPEKDDRFRVHQYYIEREGADSTKRGMPTQPSSAYSGLVPDWYSKGVWKGFKKPKGKSRIAFRIYEKYGKNELLDSTQRRYLRDLNQELRTNPRMIDRNRLQSVLDTIDPEGKDEEVLEIRY